MPSNDILEQSGHSILIICFVVVCYYYYFFVVVIVIIIVVADNVVVERSTCILNGSQWYNLQDLIGRHDVF